MLIDLETATDHRLPLSVVRGDTPMGGRWRTTDRVLAAAYRVYKQGVCDGCGGYLDDTTDVKKYGPHGTHTHEHDKPVKCWQCASRMDQQDAWSKNERYPNLLRWFTRVVKR